MISVGIVGFGRIGRVHADALAAMDGACLTAVFDPGLNHEDSVPFVITNSLRDLLDSSPLDRLLIDVPTPLHRRVFDDVRRVWDGIVLMEKPTSPALSDARAMLADAQLLPIYHAAHAPEVRWLQRALPQFVAEHGPIRTIESVFCDPYGSNAGASALYGNSWIDSGINCLSILARFVDLAETKTLHSFDGNTFEASLGFDGSNGAGTARIITSWQVAEPSKSSRLRFDDGAVVVLDHQAVGARVLADGHLTEYFGHTNATPRLVQHYLACFEAVLVPGVRTFPSEIDVRLHELLLD